MAEPKLCHRLPIRFGIVHSQHHLGGYRSLCRSKHTKKGASMQYPLPNLEAF